MILPKERHIEVPFHGWEEKTFYAVVVSLGPTNPLWGGILYTGFLNGPNGAPGGYASVWHGGTDESTVEFSDIYFLRILRKLDVTAGHISEQDLPALMGATTMGDKVK